jgi:4-hydroxythreonine-4-phosphate dehydrogenase
MDKSGKIRLGISVGDLNGIGMEVIIKTFMEAKMTNYCIPIVYGSSRTAGYHRKVLGINDWSFNFINDAGEAHPRRTNLVNVWQEEVILNLGTADKEVGAFALRSLEAAVADLKAGKIDALVTAPINKDSIQAENFQFPGHTEYLQQAFGQKEVLMFLISDRLRVGTLTGHIPLKEVPNRLGKEAIVAKLKLMNQSLQRDFGIRKPKLAVLSLNPHAGDNGLLGDEEQRIIKPALEMAQQEGLLAFGPYGADGFFGSNQFTQFDAVLGMYHDQVLAPFKALAFESGVNFTAGLPFVRTSPDHGTAYDIAGKNLADPGSFRQAVFAAIDLAKMRHENDTLMAEAIKPQKVKFEDGE